MHPTDASMCAVQRVTYASPAVVRAQTIVPLCTSDAAETAMQQDCGADERTRKVQVSHPSVQKFIAEN